MPARLCSLLLALVPALALAQAPSSDISSIALDSDKARVISNARLEAGLATIHLLEGALIPTTSINGNVYEFLFLGSGRISLQPPSRLEEEQLELFTGSRKLFENFTEAVIIVANDSARAALLSQPATTLDAAGRQRAADIYSNWKSGTERRFLAVENAIFADAAGDARFDNYFGAWLRGKQLGDFIYLLNPEDREQITLG